jgi:hypothetical protein
MNKRIINSEKILFKNVNNDIITVKANTETLHPLTCNWINTKQDKTNICLTKYKYEDNHFQFYDQNKCKTNTDNYKNYLFIPPVGISSNMILQIYDINSIDSLIHWIDINIDMYSINTINRILNCWIINNINLLKDHNNILEDIYNKLLLKFGNKLIISKINNNIIDLNKETKYFIDYWINKINNEFYLNLLEDYFNYIEKKYIVK